MIPPPYRSWRRYIRNHINIYSILQYEQESMIQLLSGINVIMIMEVLSIYYGLADAVFSENCVPSTVKYMVRYPSSYFTYPAAVGSVRLQ